ncbi:MAG: GNAT family N-acetyltransferase [Aristaeellaceae bacterium]
MIAFRDAEAADAQLISHIFATSWRKAYRGIVPQHYLDRLPEDYWVPSVRSWLESGRFSALMIYDGKRPVGCCIYGRGRDEGHEDWGEIVSLYLLPESTRQGFGHAALEESLSRMRQEGYKRFYLWALEHNHAADSFYRREGFKPTTDQGSFPIGGQTIHERRYVKVED